MDRRLLKNQVSDFEQRLRRRAAHLDEWLIVNRLPTRFHLFVQDQSGNRRELGVIEPRSELKFPPTHLRETEFLITYVLFRDTLYPFLDTLLLKDFRRKIVLGDAGFTEGEGRGIVNASNWDMRGVWIHNHTAAPLDVWYKGNLVAQIHPSGDDMGYLGGSANQVYFDNSRQGLNRGDILSFKYSAGHGGLRRFLPEGHLPDGTKTSDWLPDIILSNVQAMHVHVGIVTSSEHGRVPWLPDPFNGVYNVDTPTHSGISFFHPLTMGQSLIQDERYFGRQE